VERRCAMMIVILLVSVKIKYILGGTHLPAEAFSIACWTFASF
jgi:hypothetical protein